MQIVALQLWFSTFLSSRHTNFVQKFGGTPKCNKRTKIKKIMTFTAYYVRYLRFGGTPRWIWRHTCASRHTGWETLLYRVGIEPHKLQKSFIFFPRLRLCSILSIALFLYRPAIKQNKTMTKWQSRVPIKVHNVHNIKSQYLISLSWCIAGVTSLKWKISLTSRIYKGSISSTFLEQPIFLRQKITNLKCKYKKLRSKRNRRA